MAITLNELGERVGAHPVLGIVRHVTDVVAAEARQKCGFVHGTVAVRRDVDDQALRQGLKPPRARL